MLKVSTTSIHASLKSFLELNVALLIVLHGSWSQISCSTLLSWARRCSPTWVEILAFQRAEVRRIHLHSSLLSLHLTVAIQSWASFAVCAGAPSLWFLWPVCVCWGDWKRGPGNEGVVTMEIGKPKYTSLLSLCVSAVCAYFKYFFRISL